MALAAAMRRTPRLSPTVTIAGQRLRDCGHRERYGEQEQTQDDVEREGRRAEYASGEHDGADAKHDNAQPFTSAVEFLLQRCRFLLSGLQQSRNTADLGPHSGRDNDGPSPPVGGDRARVKHVAPIADADIPGDGVDVLRHRYALAGERSFVGLQVRNLDDPGVRRDLVAGFHQHDVAGHDLGRRDALALAVTHDCRLGRSQRHQRPHRLFGPRFLDETQHCIQHDDRHDDNRLVGQGGLARVLQQPLDHRDDDGDEQNDHQEVLELLDQPRPPRRFRGALQLIGPVLSQSPLRLDEAQAARRIGAECRDNRCCRLSVWRSHGERNRAVRYALSLALQPDCGHGL